MLAHLQWWQPTRRFTSFKGDIYWVHFSSVPTVLLSICTLYLFWACFLFCRNNTPFTSLHSLTSTEIDTSLSRPTQTHESIHTSFQPTRFPLLCIIPRAKGWLSSCSNWAGKGKHLHEANYRNNCVCMFYKTPDLNLNIQIHCSCT